MLELTKIEVETEVFLIFILIPIFIFIFILILTMHLCAFACICIKSDSIANVLQQISSRKSLDTSLRPFQAAVEC